MGALELARAFGFDEVELPDPPGFGARIRLVEIEELVRSRSAPADLRRKVMAAGEKVAAGGEAPKDPDSEVLDLTADLLEWQVAGLVRALRSAPDAAWEPVSLTPAILAELPWRTQAALRDIAHRRKTPAMVTAMVRRMRGEISEEEAVAVLQAERPKLSASWESFRDERGGPGPGAGGEDVEPEPVELPAEPRPRGGSRPRRGARAAGDGVGRRAAEAAAPRGPQ